MKAKNGTKTVVIAGIMESPLVFAVSAALLFVPCVHEIALRHEGKTM